MADDNTIIEGNVKFREGKKWKSRWCVMRKLSPVADCVQLEVYREWRGRRAGGTGGSCKAALSLQQYLGCELGFTLDAHSNTLALVCRDLVAVLAFDTRERLIQWQVKVSAHLGEARQYLVLVAAGTGAGASRARLPPGPARLHLHERRVALTAGVPPRLLGLWELPHLRRYGVVEGRFCFEGGSYCGKGEGLHVLITDQAKEIAADFDLASQGRLSPKRRPINTKKANAVESPKSQGYRPDTRLSDLNTIDRMVPPMELQLHAEGPAGEDGPISPYWPSAERTHQDMGHGDTASVHESMAGAEWGAPGHVALERCVSCMSKLGALSRSSTVALTPGAKHFSPAWTMDALPESGPSASNLPPAPLRPPKPTTLDLNLNRKPPMPLPTQASTCSCARSLEESSALKIGPYENYDVPKLASIEVDGEYYDTPKRLKECLNDELFQMTRSSTSNAVILKKPCGCLLKLGRKRRQATVLECGESAPAACPCRRVTAWAHSWLRLPYCKKNTLSSDSLLPDKENMNPRPGNHNAIYATIDLSRKTRRKTHPIDPDELRLGIDPQNVEIDRGPLANYENLNFALSLEHYENAKDLLRRVGVTQTELDAIGANLRADLKPGQSQRPPCAACGHPPPSTGAVGSNGTAGDDYLMMEPKSLDGDKRDHSRSLPSGYTPMSPIGGFAFNTLKHPTRSSVSRLLEEKSASNPTLCASAAGEERPRGEERVEYRKRSSSADSSRFLEDVQETEGGTHDSSSSLETLRDGEGAASAGAACRCLRDLDTDESKPPPAAGTRDSSSSNDSGVSSCSVRVRELPPTTAAARRHYRSVAPAPRAAPPRRSRSSDPLHASRATLPRPAKSSSAEAEVPVLATAGSHRGVVDTHSTSSGASDMSDYIETLSICSSHSSTDTPVTMRVARQTSTLRPRSGKEYGSLAPRLTNVLRAARTPAPPPPPLPPQRLYY